MDLVGMEIFARVVEAESFLGAARRLDLSKSAVSKHVTRLEAALGVQLIHRTTRSICLTEVGRQFYERCVQILAAAEEAELAAMQQQSAPRGTLKVTAPVSLGMMVVAPALPELLAHCPELRIDLRLTNRAINLIDDGFDASVVVLNKIHPGLVARPIARVRRKLCAAPAYLERAEAPRLPGDLTRHNCLVFTGMGMDGRWTFDGPEGSSTVSVQGNLCLNNLNALCLAARSGAGIALLPDYLVGPHLADGSLVELLPGRPPPDWSIHVVYPPSRHTSPKVGAFVEFMIRRFRDASSDGSLIRADARARSGDARRTIAHIDRIDL